MTHRIRGRALQERRQRWFEKRPLCVMCQAQGRTTLATELDHITPLCAGGPDTETNLQGLCSDCHKVKTAKDMGHKSPAPIGIDGWPI